MIPVASSRPVPAPFVERVNSRTAPLIDYENGGAELGVGSDSVAFQWKAESDGTTVWVSREGVPPVEVLTGAGITEVSLAFDGTMNPHIAYVEGGVAKFRYWDTLADSYQTMILAGARSPRCCADEKTPEFSAERDVVLAYLVGTEINTRVQRDRFVTERTFIPDPTTASKMSPSTRIVAIGMNTGRRLQLMLL